MVAKARDTVGWLMPNPLANCVPDWGPAARRRRNRSVWVGMGLNEIMNEIITQFPAINWQNMQLNWTKNNFYVHFSLIDGGGYEVFKNVSIFRIDSFTFANWLRWWSRK
jgi:hypothetical protein